jgi:hypothetical protein
MDAVVRGLGGETRLRSERGPGRIRGWGGEVWWRQGGISQHLVVGWARREILLSMGYDFLMFHAQFALSGIVAVSPPREQRQKANAGGTK